MIKTNTKCRDCRSGKLTKFLDLGSQPLANSFSRTEDLTAVERTYPLEVYFCSDCGLTQLVHVVNKEELFKHYVYFSSVMPKVSAYWEAYALDLTKNFLKDKSSFVVEIGSNDGVLLKFFQDRGYHVLGIDPAKNIAKLANERGINTMAAFFSQRLAETIAAEQGPANIILANNVFAHINDHYDFCAGIKKLLHPQGVLVIEAPYLIDMFENLTYDTVYHEHLSFLAVRPLIKLFERFGLEIFDVKIMPSQGQSLRLFIGHKGAKSVSENVFCLIQKELEFKLDDLNSYFLLASRIEKSKSKLVGLLQELKNQGKTIAAYGAPAKGNTLLNYCKIGPEVLDYAVDDLPLKQGKLTPGMRIPVRNRQYAEFHRPDYYLLLAWNYKKAILEKEADFIHKGGKFIIPIGDEPSII